MQKQSESDKGVDTIQLPLKIHFDNKTFLTIKAIESYLNVHYYLKLHSSQNEGFDSLHDFVALCFCWKRLHAIRDYS